MVTGLRFGVEILADYNDRELLIPFRRRVFSSCYDGEHITSYTILEIIEDEVFDRLHDEDAVRPLMSSIFLQLVLLGVEAKRRIHDWMLRLANDRVVSALQLKLIRKAIHLWINVRHSRVVPLHSRRIQTAAPSSILVRQQIGKPQCRRNLVHQIGKARSVQSATPYWQPAFPSHPGTYNWQSPIPSHMGNTNLQPPIERHHDAAAYNNQNILNRGKREQRPSFYKRTPYMEQPPTIILPKQRRGDDVIFLGGEFTGNYLVYENVDPQKVKREHYITLQEFLDIPKSVYLDCYMKGYSVPVTFWQQLVPHLCMPDIDSGTPAGWLSREHMNAWMELLIRYDTLIDLQKSHLDRQAIRRTRLYYANNVSFFPFLLIKTDHTISPISTILSSTLDYCLSHTHFFSPLTNYMADWANEARQTIVSKLQREIRAEETLANQLLCNLNRYSEEMCIRDVQITMLQTMPATSLNTYGLHALLMTLESDIRTTNNILRTRQQLLRSITAKQNFINNYMAL
ncbi:hypothetical protein Tco_0471792 [Tanacetum coccineum]